MNYDLTEEDENKLVSIWEMDDDRRRHRFYLMATRGAREALRAANAPLNKSRLRPAAVHGRWERPAPPVNTPRWRHILIEVANKHQVHVKDILSPTHAKVVVAARYECWWRIYRETPLSTGEIGKRFNRDHTTVLTGIAKHQKRIDAGEA